MLYRLRTQTRAIKQTHATCVTNRASRYLKCVKKDNLYSNHDDNTNGALGICVSLNDELAWKLRCAAAYGEKKFFLHLPTRELYIQ